MALNATTNDSIELHGRTYRLPSQPTVVVCIDGFDPDYLQQGIEDGILPNLAHFVQSGFHTTAQCAMPSVTCPNNVSIITGVPTAIHGIATNVVLDRVTGEEHFVVDDELLRGSTILELMADKGVRVAAITAKDKLRKIIDHGLSPSKGTICFSTQFAGNCTEAEHGIGNVEQWLGRPTPAQYSGDLSLCVLDVGVKLLEENRADLLYLTLSDYIQHKYAPGTPEANDFLHQLDARLGKLVELGAVVAVTADHGMSPKSKADALFLEDELRVKWPNSGARVICPIADQFVKHHGGLGSFVRVFLTTVDKASRESVADDMVRFCQSLPEVEVALRGDDAAARYEMPVDREGDFVVISKKNAVIGSRKAEYDASQLQGFELRSHGGLSEQAIPLIKSTPLIHRDRVPPQTWRNFDVFDLALNW